MGVDRTTVVRELLAELDGPQVSASHVDGILARLAPDAQWNVYAWEPALAGHDAIRAELLRQAALMSDVTIGILWMATAGSRVFMERLDSLTVNATPVTLHVAAVFDVDDDGMVTLWREYLDAKEIETKLGQGASSSGSRTGVPA